MKLVRPGCKRDAEPLDTNSAIVVSWFLLMWSSFLVLWPSFWVNMGHGFWLCGCCFGAWSANFACDIARSGPSDSLGHTFFSRRKSRLIGPIIVVRHVAFSLRRCGRTADTMMCFSFSICSQPRFFHTLLLLVLRVQTAETTRTTTSREKNFHDTATRRHANGKSHLPCHSTADSAANCPHQGCTYGQKFVVLSSLARPRVRCTVPGRSQSTQNLAQRMSLSRPRPPKNHNPNTGL